MTSAVDLATLLPQVVAAAEEAGRQIAVEFVRPNGPRGTGEHADVDDEIEASLRVRTPSPANQPMTANLRWTWRGHWWVANAGQLKR